MSTRILPTTIDEVIFQMDEIIKRCIKEKSKLGYFTTLYRDVTAVVRQKIHEGYFDDNARMEKLDVVFANRYLEAIYAYWDGKPASKCWEVAFQNKSNDKLIILQQLLLGMNAHINYDLAIATAEVAPGDKISSIENDFQKIMQLLSDMIDDVERRIETVSPSIKWLDKFGGKTDEKIAGFVIKKARDLAWKTAEKLAQSTTQQNNETLKLHDTIVSTIGKGLANPGFFLSIGLWLVKRNENQNVATVIEALKM